MAVRSEAKMTGMIWGKIASQKDPFLATKVTYKRAHFCWKLKCASFKRFFKRSQSMAI